MWRRQEKERATTKEKEKKREKKKKKETLLSPGGAGCQGDSPLRFLRREKLEQKLRTPMNGVTAAATGGERTESGEAAGRISGQPEVGEESSMDGGVNRGDGRNQEMQSGAVGAAGTPRNGGREEGERGAGGVEKTISEAETRHLVKKDLVLHVEIEGDDLITMIEMLKAVQLTCGKVLGCRAKQDKRWELTMSNIKGKERLLDGFKIKNSRIVATELVRDTRVVSFLNLPLYITDEEIKNKLCQWGVEPASNIRRRKWAGTEVYDGTRFLKVKFPDNISSLPYSTKFETLEGLEFFRVLHDQQVRVCRLCLQEGHILRDCPEFTCYRCNKQGHYARECADRKEDAMEREETMEEGEKEKSGEEDDTGRGESLSGKKTEEEERKGAERGAKAIDSEEKDSGEAPSLEKAGKNSNTPRGRGEVAEQRRDAERGNSGGRRERSRSNLRISDRGGKLNEALPQRGMREEGNKKDNGK